MGVAKTQSRLQDGTTASLAVGTQGWEIQKSKQPGQARNNTSDCPDQIHIFSKTRDLPPPQ